MPDGAQAWKLIKPPGSQGDPRISQACDRCRSKKVKCDGKRPNCSQCASVGIECKTSDKLSRRAFPRGYTEFMEDRVRQLETEVVKLNNLIEVKDEQLEMVSKLNSLPVVKQGSAVAYKGASSACPTVSIAKASAPAPPSKPANGSVATSEDDEFKIVHTDTLACDASSFIKTFAEKVKLSTPEVANALCLVTSAKSISCTKKTRGSVGSSSVANVDYLPDSPLSIASASPNTEGGAWNVPYVPSRLNCDHLITLFFQEWSTLYPIIQEKTFMRDYAIMSLESLRPHSDIFYLQLLLVCSLGALVSKDRNSTEAWKLDREWKKYISSYTAPTVANLTINLLALLHSLQTRHEDCIWQYRSLVHQQIQRLGLARKQEYANIVWTAYSLDIFAACSLGTSPLFSDSEIACKIPQEDTPAAAMYSFSKILVSIHSNLYSAANDSPSFKVLAVLEEKLEKWQRELPSKLSFKFANGTQSTGSPPQHQKSPILLMMYAYAQTLIHLPVISSSTPHISRASSSTVAACNAAKTFIQIWSYLKARSCVSTFPFNVTSIILRLSCVTLYTSLDYSKTGVLIREARKLVNTTQDYLSRDMEVDIPGSISPEGFYAFKDMHDILCPRRSSISKKATPVPAATSDRSTDVKADNSHEITSAVPPATSTISASPPLSYAGSTVSSLSPISSSSANSASSGNRKMSAADELFMNGLLELADDAFDASLFEGGNAIQIKAESPEILPMHSSIQSHLEFNQMPFLKTLECEDFLDIWNTTVKTEDY